jgi:hypothetical protein
MMPLLPPLRSFGDRTDETEAEKFWKRIPFLGWIVGSILWTNKTQWVPRRIKQQLLDRPKPDASVWGTAGLRIETAQFICKTAFQDMGWPNDHFVPNDPANILLWAFDDFYGTALLVSEIEEHFGIELKAADVEKWSDGTLETMVDDITLQRQSVAQPDASIWPPPPLRGSHYVMPNERLELKDGEWK